MMNVTFNTLQVQWNDVGFKNTLKEYYEIVDEARPLSIPLEMHF